MSLRDINIRDLVDAGVYETEDDALHDALRHLFQDRPGVRIRVAVHRYRTNEDLSLAKTAALAGVSIERMKDILDEHGVPLRLGPASVEEARAEAKTIEDWLRADTG